MLPLPERRERLHVIHQEHRGLEGGGAVAAGGDHQHDRFAGRDAAMAVHGHDSGERPAPLRLLDDAEDLRLRHAG